MKILSNVIRFLRVRGERRTPQSNGSWSSRVEARRRVATARALAKDYDALGWR